MSERDTQLTRRQEAAPTATVMKGPTKTGHIQKNEPIIH